MKHVFILQSNITFLLAEQIIDFLGIKKDMVVFFLERGYELPYLIDKAQVYNKVPCGLSFGKNFIANRIRIDKSINHFNDLISSDYIAYLPHTFVYEYSILVYNFRCVGYNYIEEGMLSYDVSNFRLPIRSLFKKIYKRFSLGSKEFSKHIYESYWFNDFNKKFLSYYSISENAFPGRKNKKVFSLTSGDNVTHANHDVVILFDALSIIGLINLKDVEELLLNVIIPHIRKSNFKRVAFKLHPLHFSTENGRKEGKLLFKYISRHFKDVVELPKNFYTEKYLQERRIVVYSFVSSLGFYAAIFGNQSFSVYNRVKVINPKINLPDSVLNVDKYKQI